MRRAQPRLLAPRTSTAAGDRWVRQGRSRGCWRRRTSTTAGGGGGEGGGGRGDYVPLDRPCRRPRNVIHPRGGFCSTGNLDRCSEERCRPSRGRRHRAAGTATVAHPPPLPFIARA